ncbi:6338_t:CDS:2 [Acaulospora colombiana]|uniref:6338_t:CDS:1 n=1 Tax=Acaulospora colombiana TaxID=27376 RepID=A0ACA9KWF8_9GLOM|nr:6338_t:CDS:2 [Acaulospora colombiana]
MSTYSRVPHAEEEDVQAIELQVPSSNAEASTSSSSNAAQVGDNNDIIETELTPMIIEEVVEESAETENETGAENGSNSGNTRFSILKKIKRKISNQPPALPSSTDGVFSNLSAKPDTMADNEDKNPPPYETAAADAAPPYLETTNITTGLCGDEMLVEGLPDDGNYYYEDPDIGDKELLARSAWISYILMALGWFIVIRSVTDYIRVKRLESTMRSNPEENV